MERLALEQMYTITEPILPQVTKSQRNKTSSRTAAAPAASTFEEAESPRHAAWEGATRRKRSRMGEEAGEDTVSWQSETQSTLFADCITPQLPAWHDGMYILT